MRLSLGTPKIAMQVAKFLDPFCRRTDVEVIVPRLPNAPRCVVFCVLLEPALFRQ